MKLWNKIGGGEDSFLDGENAELDTKLLPYDIYGTAAHAGALEKIGVLSVQEKTQVTAALKGLLDEWRKGGIEVSAAQEDSHTLIEETLCEKTGAAGEKIHAGRSRNDQALCAVALYCKHSLMAARQTALELAGVLAQMAAEHEFDAMPGYTHSRKAMPSSAGMWLSAYARLLKQDSEFIGAARQAIDSCPLGSAAGYGSLAPLDNAATAQTLGFSKPVENALAAQMQRGKAETVTVFAMSAVMGTISRLAADLILFSMPQTGFVSLGGAHSTGSSIMPQKRNPDGLELVRAKAAAVNADLAAVQNICCGLPAGYHRDHQETKRPLVHAVETTLASLDAMEEIISGISLDTEKMLEACTPEIFAADYA
ncbi:MAG: argininosuccinate lyase, partial [Candidatus Micrarchaeota archaeon]